MLEYYKRNTIFRKLWLITRTMQPTKKGY